MLKLLIIITIIFPGVGLYAQDITQDDGYYYQLDLNAVSNDQAEVILTTPKVEQESIVLYFPKVIPGTYRIADFGRFISDVKAFSSDGTLLPVEKIETNGWRISNAQSLYKITYKVDDTFDAVITENPIYKMGGTNIQEGEAFLINTHGFFGYLEDMKDRRFTVDITHPSGFYGSTGMVASDNEEGKDLFITENYNRLVDSPIMYTRPDTTVMHVGGADVIVAVYSPNKLVTSKFMAEGFKKVLEAQKEYLGGTLPVDKYAFIMYFQDMEGYESDAGVGGFAFGALEHSYSSVYFMPDAPEKDLIDDMLRIAAHEFFHIVTPLNIHSEEIHYFDFNEPKMSEHLWLYEGVVEYFAHHVQVQYGIKTVDQFLDAMSEKISTSQRQFDDKLPFTVMSKGSLDKYKDEYLNVYEKGAIIGMVLDLILLDLSDGKYGLNDMMMELSKKYGKDKPFRDEELFGVIVEMTYPEIGEFLNYYVAGSTPLPLKNTLALAGVEFKEKEIYKDFTLGNIQFGYNPATKRLYVANTDAMDEFGKAMGYRSGDEFHAINGKEIPTDGIQQYFEEIFDSFKEGEDTEIEVMRDGKKVTLSAEMMMVDKVRYNILSLMEDPSPQQIKIRNAWLKP
jgi:predicted metalloprotease with PDZ domain